MVYLSSYKSFCDDVFELHEDWVLAYYYHMIYICPQSFQLHYLNPNHKLVHLQPIKVHGHVDFHDFEIM
jgi:hypothetical protein